MTFISEKIFVLTTKISDDLFLVIDQVFRISPFFSQIFRMFRFTMLNVVYEPFLTRKTLFYSVHTSARIGQLCFSKNWGDGYVGRPPASNFWGTVPLGLRPLLL